MGQLLLPMPAKPLPPLELDGERQAERMAFLNEIAEWRRWHSWLWRSERRCGWGGSALDANMRREVEMAMDDMRAFRAAWVVR